MKGKLTEHDMIQKKFSLLRLVNGKVVMGIVVVVLLLVVQGHSTRNKTFQPQPFGMVYVSQSDDIPRFWMSEMEVTNSQYLEYLRDLLYVGDTAAYLAAYPDTARINASIWISKEYPYFEDEFFWNYPVVGLTVKQMEGYANWMGDWLREKYAPWKMKTRLPTEAEWRHACTADLDFEAEYVHGKNYKNSMGCYLMWFFHQEDRMMVSGEDSMRYAPYFWDDSIHYDFANEWYKLNTVKKKNGKLKWKKFDKLLPYAGLPVPGWSYFPNVYGLYNLTGNVAEVVRSADGTIRAVGGSFRTSSQYCKIRDELPYPYDPTQPQIDLGFRLVCEYEPPNFDTQYRDTKKYTTPKSGDD